VEHGVWEDYYLDGTLRWREHRYQGRLKGLNTMWNAQGIITDKFYHLVIR
jgi:hypothetical protein